MNGYEQAARRLLHYLHCRGAYRVAETYPDLTAVPWEDLYVNMSSGERLVLNLAEDLSFGHLPTIHHVLASVDRGYAAVIGEAISLVHGDAA